MSDAFHDPRSHVDAPVVRALELIVVRGAASFAVAVVAVLTTVWSHDGPLHTVGHLALPIVLTVVVAARAIHVWLARHDPVAGDGAWSRAGDVDAGNARFAAVVVALVPVAWLIGGAAILLRHAGTREELAGVVGLWGPLGAASWFLATIAWLGDCRERLARSLVESERRFRQYWAGVRPPA